MYTHLATKLFAFSSPELKLKERCSCSFCFGIFSTPAFFPDASSLRCGRDSQFADKDAKLVASIFLISNELLHNVEKKTSSDVSLETVDLLVSSSAWFPDKK